MTIQEIVAHATKTVDAIEDSANYPVPRNKPGSVMLLVYQAGISTARAAADRMLRSRGFNGLANDVNDLVI